MSIGLPQVKHAAERRGEERSGTYNQNSEETRSVGALHNVPVPLLRQILESPDAAFVDLQPQRNTMAQQSSAIGTQTLQDSTRL